MTGAELKALAKGAGMTAKELASSIGVSSGTMSRYCQSDMVPLHIELASRYVVERADGNPKEDTVEARLAALIRDVATGGSHDR